MTNPDEQDNGLGYVTNKVLLALTNADHCAAI